MHSTARATRSPAPLAKAPAYELGDFGDAKSLTLNVYVDDVARDVSLEVEVELHPVEGLSTARILRRARGEGDWVNAAGRGEDVTTDALWDWLNSDPEVCRVAQLVRDDWAADCREEAECAPAFSARWGA